MSALPDDAGICACGCGEPFWRRSSKGRARIYIKNHRQRVYQRQRDERREELEKAVQLGDLPEIDMHKLAVGLIADAWRNKVRYPNAREFLLAEDEDTRVMLAFWCHVADLSLNKVVARARKEFGNDKSRKVAQGGESGN